MRKRFRYFGPDTALTPLAQAIMDEDTDYLNKSLGLSWQLNKPFEYCKHGFGLAIQLALVESKFRVVDYLLEQKVDLNVPNSPAIVSAVSSLNTQIMDKIIALGANVHSRNNVGYDALDQAVAWEYFELIPYLESVGLNIKDHRGSAFNNAVFSGNYDFVEYALKKGADPNTNLALKNGGTGATPLHSAVIVGNVNMVKLLLSHKADPSLTDIHGQRPYHWALANGNNLISSVLRHAEPSAFHDPEQKRKLAKGYKTPLTLISFFESKDRTLRTKNDQPVAELLSIEDLYEFHWMENTFLTISKAVNDDYSCGDIVWCKKRMQICIIDTEHDELFRVGSWDKFAANSANLIEQIWEGGISPD